jgi:NAD(P)-dependent dehydrogenase (short-subunit alcohol dehydrogenase family)
MFRLTYDTNVTGPHLLTTALAPLLLKSASPRLIFLASGTASFKLSEDDTFILNHAPEPGWPKQTFRELPAYKSSKIALNMIMRDWERLLRKDGVKVWAVNPGFLATGLGGMWWRGSMMRCRGRSSPATGRTGCRRGDDATRWHRTTSVTRRVGSSKQNAGVPS